MQIAPILLCLGVLSIAQSALVTRIPKPKLNSVLAEKLKTLDIPKQKSPEERRKFSLFPKSYMKYVISPEPIYKIATHKPIVHGTKKPLMKKLKLQDKGNKVVENEAEPAEQSMVNAEPMNESNSALNPKVVNDVVSEEANIEAVEDKSKQNNEKKNDDSEEEEKETLILPQHVEFTAENKNLDAFADVVDINKKPKEIETEFILVDAIHKPSENDKISSEEPEEFVTTEFYEDPEIVRSKRGSNIIEEENLASTVAGYKYTWKDTRLNTDVAFKNIHS